jgi:hypothetical protein
VKNNVDCNLQLLLTKLRNEEQSGMGFQRAAVQVAGIPCFFIARNCSSSKELLFHDHPRTSPDKISVT